MILLHGVLVHLLSLQSESDMWKRKTIDMLFVAISKSQKAEMTSWIPSNNKGGRKSFDQRHILYLISFVFQLYFANLEALVISLHGQQPWSMINVTWLFHV